MATDRHFPNSLADYKPTAIVEHEIPETQTIGTLGAAAAAAQDLPVKVPPEIREHSFPSSELFLKAAIDLKNEGPIVDAILAAGRAGAGQTKCPLMYQWHGTRYWGAAHGLAGIMHVLMHFPLSEEDCNDVKNTLRYMIKNRFLRGNYPSSEGNNRDRLVHWCHGAPGIALTLCKAAEVYPEDEEFRLAALEAADVVWERGLLRRVGLCHGVSGNAYVFLALHRVFGGKKHLHRAKSFAGFLHDRAFSLVSTGEMHGGDHPHSLYEGLAGTACLWLDVTQPEMSAFPGYEL